MVLGLLCAMSIDVLPIGWALPPGNPLFITCQVFPPSIVL